MARQFSRPGNYRVVVSHERHLCCCLRCSSLLSSYLSIFCFRPIFPFSSFQPFLFIGGFDSSALCRSRRELSNAYLLAKFGFDTAETEPCKVCLLSAYRSPRLKRSRARGCNGRTAQNGVLRENRFKHRTASIAFHCLSLKVEGPRVPNHASSVTGYPQHAADLAMPVPQVPAGTVQAPHVVTAAAVRGGRDAGFFKDSPPQAVLHFL